MFEAPQQASQANASRENNNKAKTMTNSIQAKERRVVQQQVSTYLKCLWKLPDKLMRLMVCPEDLSWFSCNWEWERLAHKPIWKAFLFMTSSLVIKIRINHVYYTFLLENLLWGGKKGGLCPLKMQNVLPFRAVSTGQLFLLETSCRNCDPPCKSVHSGLGIYREIPAPPTQPSCSR